MRKNKRKIFEIFSDLSINLSSGFLGAAVIIPIFSKEPLELNFTALISDFVVGILFLVVAIRLKI